MSRTDASPDGTGPGLNPSDPDRFRQVLGHFATGVVVVCAERPDGPCGLTVNSFVSVSLDPPLVAFCAAHSSSTWPRMRNADRLAVSVLGRDHQEVCHVFARKGVDRFAAFRWHESPGGQPVLDGAAAWLDCVPETIHRAGDHDLVLLRVTALSAAPDPDPLIFYRGAFAALDPARAAPQPGEFTDLDAESPFFPVLSAHRTR